MLNLSFVAAVTAVALAGCAGSPMRRLVDPEGERTRINRGSS